MFIFLEPPLSGALLMKLIRRIKIQFYSSSPVNEDICRLESAFPVT